MIALLSIALAAGGIFESGNDLYETCMADRQGACSAYVAGIADEISTLQATKSTKPLYCPSPRITLGQARDIVLKYLIDHPEQRDQYAASLASVALWTAFPCPIGRPK